MFDLTAGRIVMPSDAGPIGADCASYCGLVTTNCTGDNAQFEDSADCLAFCAGAGWTVGTVDDTAGATLGCHIYHAGVPAAGASSQIEALGSRRVGWSAP